MPTRIPSPQRRASSVVVFVGALACAILGSTRGARAQTLSEPGWTALYDQATLGNTGAVAIGPDGTVYWGPLDGASSDDNRKPIAARTPIGPGTGRVKILHNTALVGGLNVGGGYLTFSTDGTSTLERLATGQVPSTWVGDFRPGNNGDDDPAGIARVPAGWVGGAIVSPGDLLVADSSSGNGNGNNNSDVVYRVTATGVPSKVGNDPGNDVTLVDVAVSRTRILVADRQGDRIFAFASLGGVTSDLVALTITGGLGGSPVGIAWDPATPAGAPESFIVALAAGTVVRLSAPVAPATAWTRTQIGAGFAFDSAATQVVALSDDGATLVLAASARIHAFARCQLAGAADCNGNGDADVCEVLLLGAGRNARDCDDNLVPDACDIASGVSTDCDRDGVPDECGSCVAPVELVFVVDTSNSMNDEAATLCDNLGAIISALESEGIAVRATLYAVGLDNDDSYLNDPSFACLADHVGRALGASVPGTPAASGNASNQDTLYEGCGGINAAANQEDWGRATSVVIGRYPWPAGSIPLVVAVSDEGPWCGSGLDQADTDAAAWAGTLGRNRNVIVSTILASGYYNSGNLPMEALAVALANATGGTVTRELSGPELVEAMKGVVRDACLSANDCDQDGVPDLCQIAAGAADCNNNMRLDRCEGIVCNTAPEVGDATIYQAVGDATASYSVASAFNDPEGDAVGQVLITGPVVGGGAIGSAGTVVFTPSDPRLGAIYKVPFRACDDGTPAACDDAVLTVIYNDPPVLAPVSVTSAWSKTIMVPFSRFFVSTGNVHGDDPSDDVDGIRSTRVGTSPAGPFASAAQAGGIDVTLTSNDTADVSARFGAIRGRQIFYLQVCEEIPSASGAVCAVTALTLAVTECLSDGDCAGALACDTSGDVLANRCWPCVDDARYPGVDRGCGATAPVCVEQGAISGGVGATIRTCVVCSDDVVGNAPPDDGCGATAPVCNESVPGGRCGECVNDADCAGGRVCDSSRDVCVGCVDDRSAGTVDTGCNGAQPVCMANAGGRCVACEDDKGPGFVDWGCGAAQRYCEVGMAGGPQCVACVNDADCEGEAVCLLGACRDVGTTSAVDDQYTTEEGVTLVTTANDGLAANDSYPAGSAAQVEVRPSDAPAAQVGLFVLSPDGAFTFVPAAGFAGTTRFPYTLVNLTNGTRAGAWVTIRVEGAPRLVPDHVVTPEDTTARFDPRGNDGDPNGDPLTELRIVNPPRHGVATVEGGALIAYAPEPDYNGPDSVLVEVCDATGRCATSLATIDVRPVDDAPVAHDDSATTQQGASVRIDVLANDSDIDSPALSVRLGGAPSHGAVSVGPDGVATYAPDAPFFGIDTFGYAACDSGGNCASALVRVTVTMTPVASNMAPIARGEDVVTPEDTAVLVVVLANDIDPDGDALRLDSITVGPRHGSVRIVARDVLYTPASDYFGADVFTYRVCDVQAACSTASSAITVTPVNDAPRANDDFYAARPDASSHFDVVLNDSDPELDPLAVARIVSQPARGRARANLDGTVTYEAIGAGTVTFRYEVCDPAGLCDQATVSVVVGTNNRNPDPADDEASTLVGRPTTIDVLANDRDPDGDRLRLHEIEDPAHGLASIVSGQVEYTPDLDFVGIEMFFYTVCDTAGACATAYVIVAVEPGENRAPQAIDDTIETGVYTPVTFDPTLNDLDFDGDALRVQAVGSPSNGTVRHNPNGTLTYTPAPAYVGPDRFDVTIEDTAGLKDDSTVFVLVTPSGNRPPDARDDFYDAPSDVASALAVLLNDVDPDGDPRQIVDVVQPQQGTVTIVADGTLLLRPDPGYFGPDRFSYTLSDGRGGFDTAEVRLVIGDRDHDGLGDGWEVQVTRTDPDDDDTDDDGLNDGEELAGGDPLRYDPRIDTDPLDADSDDDGLSDGVEVRGDPPLRAPTDPLDPDSDDDGVGDGVEVGVQRPVPGGTSDGGLSFAGTDTSVWIPDADPSTTTDPLDDDSDDDGLIDGREDTNGNGRRDGEIGGTGTPGAGETDAADPDTDGDGIADGVELGLTAAQGNDTDLAIFQPDLDPTSTTDPRDSDSDDGGVGDGDEDVNHNGYRDPGEIDPNSGGDDRAVVVAPDLGAEGSSCGTAGSGELMLVLTALLMALALRRSARAGRDRRS